MWKLFKRDDRSAREKLLEEKIQLLEQLHAREIAMWKERGDRLANAERSAEEEMQKMRREVLSLISVVKEFEAYKIGAKEALNNQAGRR